MAMAPQESETVAEVEPPSMAWLRRRTAPPFHSACRTSGRANGQRGRAWLESATGPGRGGETRGNQRGHASSALAMRMGRGAAFERRLGRRLKPRVCEEWE